MPQLARNAGAVDSVPMVIDQGQRGLEQSRHHLRAGEGAYNSTRSEDEAESSTLKPQLRDILVGRVIPGKEEELEEELKAWIKGQERRVDATRPLITRAEIKDIVTQVIEETQKPRETTWAAVAARSPSPQNGPVVKEVLARLKREIVICTSTQLLDLARRSPQEVIQAI